MNNSQGSNSQPFPTWQDSEDRYESDFDIHNNPDSEESFPYSQESFPYPVIIRGSILS